MIADKIINCGPLQDEYGYPIDWEGFFTYSFPRNRINRASFESCREIFGYHFRGNTTGLGYTESLSSIERVSDFFDRIETRLGIEEKTVFYRTNAPKCIIAEVSPWWRANVFRRNVFTMMLRIATRHYRTGTVNNGIARYPLTKGERVGYAIRRFLNGHTELHKCRIGNGCDGVHSQFSRLTKAQIRAKLVTQ